MINVDKLGAYYFPLDKKPRGQFLTLELYSELSLSSIVFDEIGGEVVGDYWVTQITSGMCEQVSNGEYNYTLYDNTDGEKISIGLIRFDLEEGGQTDDEEYVVYQDDFDGYVQAIELTTTAFTENGVYEAQDKGWHEVTVNIDTDWYYTSGYTDGYESGMTDGKEIGYQSGYTNGYQSGFTDGVSSVPLTSITIDANGSYTAENGGYNSIVVDVPTGITPEEYVTFTSQQANSTIGLVKLSTNQQLWYSTDGDNWSAMTTGTTVSLVNSGDSVYVRGVLSNNNSSSNYTNFRMSGTIAASGNINYIWNYENPDAALKEYCGYRLFSSCTSLVIAPELPAMVLSRECYGSMFRGCTSLTQAPKLPAMTLAFQCYSSMFNGCTSLTQAPQLPATSINSECYAHMFSDCTSLTTAPELPAKTAMSTCYKNMFTRCTALTVAPVLPATLMGQQAYEGMFMGCTNLTTVPYIAMPEIAWIGCANMFENCRSLNYVKCAATSFKDSATREWFRLVPAGGTFVRDYNATWSTGINGIPEGWTVLMDNVPESALS